MSSLYANRACSQKPAKWDMVLETILLQTLLPRGPCQLRVVQGPSLFPSILPKEILCREGALYN